MATDLHQYLCKLNEMSQNLVSGLSTPNEFGHHSSSISFPYIQKECHSARLFSCGKGEPLSRPRCLLGDLWSIITTDRYDGEDSESRVSGMHLW